MSGYRPLAGTGEADPRFDALHDGVPPWMRESLLAWLRPFVWSSSDFYGARFEAAWVRALENRMRLDPLPWADGENRVAKVLFERISSDGEFAIQLLDYTLRHLGETYSYSPDRDAVVYPLVRDLHEGGSAWEVRSIDENGTLGLVRRALGPVVDAVQEVRSIAERAGAHLYEAWRHLAGRNPLPDQAYLHAVFAVEAAAKPVVSPNDSSATLGKMRNAIRDKPGKWTFSLGNPVAVVEPMSLLWDAHVRHGTDDRTAPMGMSAEQADAGLHLALTLTRWFVSGAFRLRPDVPA